MTFSYSQQTVLHSNTLPFQSYQILQFRPAFLTIINLTFSLSLYLVIFTSPTNGLKSQMDHTNVNPGPFRPPACLPHQTYPVRPTSYRDIQCDTKSPVACHVSPRARSSLSFESSDYSLQRCAPHGQFINVKAASRAEW